MGVTEGAGGTQKTDDESVMSVSFSESDASESAKTSKTTKRKTTHETICVQFETMLRLFTLCNAPTRSSAKLKNADHDPPRNGAQN